MLPIHVTINLLNIWIIRQLPGYICCAPFRLLANCFLLFCSDLAVLIFPTHAIGWFSKTCIIFLFVDIVYHINPMPCILVIYHRVKRNWIDIFEYFLENAEAAVEAGAIERAVVDLHTGRYNFLVVIITWMG